ncbi:MAG: ATP-binding protein [Myxococcota bacterium]
MRIRFGLGLRALILIGLTVVFVASFPLLGVAAVQLTQRARAGDRIRNAEVTARALASTWASPSQGPSREGFRAGAEAVRGHAGIAGVELVRSEGAEPWVQGTTRSGTAVEAPAGQQGTVRLWVRPPAPESGAPFARLLLLYVAVTAGGILLLAYVALTYLIVRPVERVTQAAERLAGGSAVRAPVGGAAEVARLAGAFNDMAAQLRAERLALEERLRELEDTTSSLQAAQDQVLRTARLASVGRLSAGVAHEIGNPLSAILGLIDLVREEDLPHDERNELLSRIQSETERIHHIIRDLLDFARPPGADGGGEEDAGGQADPIEVVDDAVRLVAPQKDLRNVRLERRFAEDVPAVRGSADRLTQVVLNLLLNAADAIEGEGTLRIEVGPDPDAAGRVLLAVQDTGPGVAPDVRAHLFEPFVTTKPAGKGTGLGLAVCHTLVERLGGTISLANPPEGGARFEVRLPVAQR